MPDVLTVERPAPASVGNGRPGESDQARRVAVYLAYGALGFLLCASRLIGLGRSFWHDEIVAVVDFIRPGPSEILFGTYIPNNHQLFSFLGWMTSSAVGESEIALRLWSAVPFILGVLLVTAWLHRRMGAPPAVLYLLLCTLSPLLLDLSRQARGYGLAYLAMSALIVAALEADRSERTWLIAAFCAAGVIGTWTLPILGVAFLGTGAALLTNRVLRWRTALALAISTLAVITWYAPRLGDLLRSSEQRFGEPISWAGIVTAPVERVLLPAYLGTDGTTLTTSLGRLLLIAAAALVLVSSPLLREARLALIIGSGLVATLVVVWAARLYLSPRFVSFLLVPLLVFFSTGTAHILAGRRKPGPRLVVALTIVILAAIASASASAEFLRFPREAHKDAAAIIDTRTSPTTPVLNYSRSPTDLAFYLERPVQLLGVSEVVPRVCESSEAVVFVSQIFRIPPVDVPCLRRPGGSHYRLRQYSRGGEINVWFVPPRR